MQNYYLIINCCYKKTPNFIIISLNKMDGVPLLILFIAFIIFGILSMLLYVYCKDKQKHKLKIIIDNVRKKEKKLLKKEWN